MGDSADNYVFLTPKNKAEVPRGSSDARRLLPYRIDQSMILRDGSLRQIKDLDATASRTHRVHALSVNSRRDDRDSEEGMLVRAANLIGQLGDPQYLRKANALYYEFEEVGMNKQLGYTSPADLIDLYPKFYWNSVAAHIRAQCAT